MFRFEDNARHWSNREIRRALSPLPPLASVVNISGYDDRDKQGARYCDYFKADEYAISYYPSDQQKGQHSADAVPFDLMDQCPRDLEGKFELAFSHTVLEHVPNPFHAFEKIVRISRDLVLTVVPFRQQLHFIQDQFGDYFRFSPMAMRYLHESNGMETLFEAVTPSPAGEVYVVSLGTKVPAAHANYPRAVSNLAELNGKAGRLSFSDSLAHVVHRALSAVWLRK